MAVSGFFALLDDVAALLDDAAAMAKIATKKTSAILVDDMAVNANKTAGFHSQREVPVIWQIVKGSLLNKLIIVPFALLMSAFLPWLVVPVLIVAGLYLAYEGAEKVFEWARAFTGKEAHENDLAPLTEQEKIKSAIVTDFILSLEIVVFVLGLVATQPLVTQIMVVSAVAVVATVGVYGLVALIIRLDDMGLWLINRSTDASKLTHKAFELIGTGMVNAMPHIIRILAVVGTLAMLLVGGGILAHNIEIVHLFVEASIQQELAEMFFALACGTNIILVIRLINSIKKKVRYA
jgi:predicted DNA repair protein MutK